MIRATDCCEGSKLGRSELKQEGNTGYGILQFEENYVEVTLLTKRLQLQPMRKFWQEAAAHI